MISTQQLLSGKSIKFDGVGTFVPPTLGKIFSCAGDTHSNDKYILYLNTLQMTLKSFLKVANLSEYYDGLSETQKEQCTLYKFLISEETMRNVLLESFSFFIAEKVIFDEIKCEFHIVNDNNVIGCINEKNFDTVRFNILRMNCISAQEIRPLKFKSEKARRIYEQCQKGKQELEKAKAQSKTDDKYKLENLVAYVATKSFQYDMYNIWDLTIYQFQTILHRLNLYNQLDTYTKRWSTWGKDSFDFSTWYNNIEILK